MASVTVNTGSLELSGQATIAAIDAPAAPFGPKRITFATGTSKRLEVAAVALAVMDTSGFSVDQVCNVVNNGNGTATITPVE